MRTMPNAMIARAGAAVRRSARCVAAVFLTYVLSAAVGAVMVHAGNPAALARRDAMVGRALVHDRASVDYGAGRRFRAALEDAAANLGLAALPQTVLGATVVLPFVTVARQGWAGGLVSVDGHHASRLRTARGAAYYLGVLLLQFIAFSLCIGGGVRCGVVLYRENRDVGWRLWRYRLAHAALADLALVVGTSVPLFLLASSFEFLSSWNG